MRAGLSSFLLFIVLGVAACQTDVYTDDFRVAYDAQGSGKFELAIQHYTKAIRSGDLSHRQLVNAYYNRGLAYSRIRDNDSAMADYSQAIDLDPKMVKAWSSRCFQKVRRDQLDDALKDCTEALRLAPNHAPTINHRAIIWEKKGMYDEALKDLTHAIRINPDKWVLHYNRGNYFRRRGDKDNAKSNYATAFEKAPSWARTNPRWRDRFREYGLVQ